jgi:hypothetical protein
MQPIYRLGVAGKHFASFERFENDHAQKAAFIGLDNFGCDSVNCHRLIGIFR